MLGKYWQVLPATPELMESFQGIATCTDQEAKDYANVLLEAAKSSITKKQARLVQAIVDKVLEIAKGDKQGHNFHGNQWTGGIGETETINNVRWSGTKEGWNAYKALTDSKNVPRIKVGVPKGWKQTGNSPDGKQIFYKSKNGTTAIFAKGSKGWKPDERLSVAAMNALDKFGPGKTLDFTKAPDANRETGAWVVDGEPNVINMGKWSTVAFGTYWRSGEIPGMADAPQELKDFYNKNMTDGWPAAVQEEITPESMSKPFTYGDKIVNPEASVDSTITHELGHTSFDTQGMKINQIFPALEKTTQELRTTPVDWQKSQENAIGNYIASNPRTSGWRQPDGSVIQRADMAAFLLNQGAGRYLLNAGTQKILQSMGMSRYGSSSLQEMIAEAHSAFQSQLIPDTPLIKNIADVMGWTKVDKSARVGFMSKNTNSTNGVAPIGYVADGALGPMWVEGDKWLDANGEWHDMDTSEPTDFRWLAEGKKLP